MLIRKGHKYKGHKAITLDKNNKLIKHFEEQSEGFEEEEYRIFIPKELIKEWHEKLKNTDGIDY